jgi:methylated-DNA-[protein]-cysteine S-methyltransferase
MRASETDGKLAGLWFEGQKYYPRINGWVERESEPLAALKIWLMEYFALKSTAHNLPLALAGTTFQSKVWEILRQIPYGQTITYGEIAKKIARNMNLKAMSAQAVGGAVGHNPLSILVPCHRVLGVNGSITGYAGGLDKKRFLLCLEGVNVK